MTTMNLIDTHCHIYDQPFDPDRKETIDRACEAGITRIMMPAIDRESYQGMFNAAMAYPNLCLPMMGLHPTSVNGNPDFRADLETVAGYLASPPDGLCFYGVGEIGLDFYWDRNYVDEQVEAFRVQIELSLEHHLPLIIHTRDAWPKTLEVLSEFKGRGLRGIMHSFSGTLDDYRTVKEIGRFLFGIGGVVTFKKSLIAEQIKQIPLEDIVLETDAPYLTPVPFRGKRNEPSYVKIICNAVASLKGTDPEDVANTTTANAYEMFGL